MLHILSALLCSCCFTVVQAVAPQPASAGAPATAAATRPNLVLVTIDTLRADHLGCYGYLRPTSPAIDALAAESLFFERCYATVPHTTPSHCSIFTGVYPFEHGVTACSFRATEAVQSARAFTSTPQLRTFTQILEDHGWQTGGFVTAATVKRITGLAVGFQAWTEPSGEFRPGAEALADALTWLQGAQEPFFLWLHLFDVHAPPRATNRQYAGQFAVDDRLRTHMKELCIPATIKGERGGGSVATAPQIVEYDASLRLVDDHVRRLREAVEQRGSWPRTTFVLTGDHGEGLGQHGFMTHGLVWGEQLRVPLMIRVPGRPPERIARVVSGIDVLPTALELTPGLPKEEFLIQARGRNAGSADFEERPVFSMSPPARGEFSLTTSRWKFIDRTDGEDALYDLDQDPHELADLKEAYPKIAAAFDQQLQILVREMKLRRRYYAEGGTETKLTPEEEVEMRRALEALGYAEDDGN